MSWVPWVCSFGACLSAIYGGKCLSVVHSSIDLITFYFCISFLDVYLKVARNVVKGVKTMDTKFFSVTL